MAGQPKTRAKRAAEVEAVPTAGEQPDAAGTPSAADRKPADRAPRSRKQRTPQPTPAPELGAGVDRDRRPAGIRKIQDGLTQLFTLAGLGVAMFVDDYDGQVVVLNAERNARAWADLAAQSPAVRRALEMLLTGSAWGAALGCTATTAIPILVRHGMAPPDAMIVAGAQGVKLPQVGESDRPTPTPATSFRPGSPDGPPVQPAAPIVAEPEPDRHPMDGSPVGDAPPAPPRRRAAA